jgi:two-component system phosphate regulon sensor histidine kinase PhoR
VQDHGIGILQSELNSIFDSYYRSGKNTGNISGTGIGLTLVKHIVNAHNAKIEVESEPGQGSTFRIIFNEYKE